MLDIGFTAIEAIFQVIQEQSTPTFDIEGNIISFYNIVCFIDKLASFKSDLLTTRR